MYWKLLSCSTKIRSSKLENAINEYQWFSFFDYCRNEFYKPEVSKEYERWRKEQKQKTAEQSQATGGTTTEIV